MAKGKKSGRPRYEVDWSVVDKLLECDVSAHQVAARLNISYSTLNRRFFDDERNIIKDEATGETIGEMATFEEYITYKKGAGVARLLEAATDEAIKNRTPSMLVFLLKNRAGYTDKRETTHAGQVSVYPSIEITNSEDDDPAQDL